MSSAEEEIMSEDLYHEQEPLGGKPSAGKYTGKRRKYYVLPSSHICCTGFGSDVSCPGCAGRIGRRPSDPVRMRKKVIRVKPADMSTLVRV